MRHLPEAISTFQRRSGISARRLALVTSTVAGLGAAMFVPGAANPSANFFATPAFAKSDEATSAARGWLGIRMQALTPEIAESMGMKSAEGVLIAEPQPNSPAAKSGLKAGDVIASIDGARVKDTAELARKIADTKPGSSIEVGIVRDGAEQAMTVTLGERKGNAQAAAKAPENRASEPRIGLIVGPAESAGSNEGGVLVTGIDPTGIAADHGFRVGDIILEVAGRAVKTPDDVRKALADARSGQRKHVLMRVKSEDVTKFVAVPLPRA